MACKTENGETVDEALKNLILVIKENIKVRRFVRYEGVCSAYVHGGGTHGKIGRAHVSAFWSTSRPPTAGFCFMMT